MDDASRLLVIGDYFDAVPRATAKVETLGGLHVFDPAGLASYAGRPRLDRESPVTVDDVHEAMARMRELDTPIFFEWVEELAPEMSAGAEAAGLQVDRYPLMVLTGDPRPADVDEVVIRMVPHTDREDFLAVRQAVGVGFFAGGTEVDRDPETGPDERAERARTLAERGLLVQFGAFDASTNAALGGGAHIPRPETGASEVTGIGVRPSARRRGIGTALASAMAAHALETGIETVFLGAESDVVAAIYGRVGFRRIGTACAAEEPSGED